MKPNSQTMSVALLVGDEVVAFSDDVTAVRGAAALIATARRTAEPAAMRPFSEARRVACRMVALGAGT